MQHVFNFVLHISLHRFWRTPDIDSTRAQSTRAWLWWPGTPRLTLSTYTRSVATNARKFPVAETVKRCCVRSLSEAPPLPKNAALLFFSLTLQLLCRKASAGTILAIVQFNNLKKPHSLHFLLISVLRFPLNYSTYLATSIIRGILKMSSPLSIDSPLNFSTD